MQLSDQLIFGLAARLELTESISSSFVFVRRALPDDPGASATETLRDHAERRLRRDDQMFHSREDQQFGQSVLHRFVFRCGEKNDVGKFSRNAFFEFVSPFVAVGNDEEADFRRIDDQQQVIETPLERFGSIGEGRRPSAEVNADGRQIGVGEKRPLEFVDDSLNFVDRTENLRRQLEKDLTVGNELSEKRSRPTVSAEQREKVLVRSDPLGSARQGAKKLQAEMFVEPVKILVGLTKKVAIEVKRPVARNRRTKSKLNLVDPADAKQMDRARPGEARDGIRWCESVEQFVERGRVIVARTPVDEQNSAGEQRVRRHGDQAEETIAQSVHRLEDDERRSFPRMPQNARTIGEIRANQLREITRRRRRDADLQRIRRIKCRTSVGRRAKLNEEENEKNAQRKEFPLASAENHSTSNNEKERTPSRCSDR